jgi:hypothetical protein
MPPCASISQRHCRLLILKSSELYEAEASRHLVFGLAATVGVGTRIAPRPPHRSRRTLLTHRAPPSGRTSIGTRLEAARDPAHSRQSERRVTRLSVRTTAACRLFPSGEALPSTTSAGSCLPLLPGLVRADSGRQ